MRNERGDHPIVCPHEIRFEVMRMWWRNLTFVHWRYPADEVQALLPDSLTVDTFDGSAWVGLIPFEMEVMLPGGIPVPREGSFPETNVRTYVRSADGTPGVWFHSLEAGRLLATVVARSTYGLPYFWASMEASGAGPYWTYRSTRRWPKPAGAASEIAVELGDPIADAEQSALDRFLTARWGLFSTFASRTLYAPVRHGVWPLQRAKLLHLDDELVTAAGLTAPEGDPVVHWTRGTEVRVARPRLAT